MISLTENLWIGNSADGKNIHAVKICGILNVAHDLKSFIGWPEVEYMQVGIIDGPGNFISTYYAAIITLRNLLKKHNTLVCCHTGGRSLAVCLMYLEACECRLGWDKWVGLLEEKACVSLPVPNIVHRVVFENLNFDVIQKILEVDK